MNFEESQSRASIRKEIESKIRKEIEFEEAVSRLDNQMKTGFSLVDKRFLEMAKEVESKNKDFKRDAEKIKEDLEHTNELLKDLSEEMKFEQFICTLLKQFRIYWVGTSTTYWLC